MNILNLVMTLVIANSIYGAGTHTDSGDTAIVDALLTPTISPLQEAAIEGDVDTINKLLISESTDVNQVDGKGNTPLHWAAMSNKLAAVEALLKAKKIDVNLQNSEGLTPLMLAAQDGHKEIVKLLLAAGADLNIKDRTIIRAPEREQLPNSADILKDIKATYKNIDQLGQTALMKAVTANHEDIVKLLLDAGAHIYNTAIKLKGRTPAFVTAIDLANGDIQKLLSEKDKALDPLNSRLREAAQGGNKDEVRKALNEGANINSLDKHGLTPLHLATREGHKDIVKLLIDSGANIDFASGIDRNTPLYAAAGNNYTDISKLLIDSGANVNAINIYGSTPLHVVSYNGNQDILKRLLDAGAHVNAVDKFGRTPLYWASKYEHKGIVKLLKDAGAN